MNNEAIIDSFVRLNPKTQLKNPVMFVVYAGAIACSVISIFAFSNNDVSEGSFSFFIAFWLWATVLFANFATAIAESKGRAQANSLKRTRNQLKAKRYIGNSDTLEEVSASDIDLDDKFLVIAGEVIPADGEVISGMAFVDESAITGESAPVIRESGGDRSSVTAGTMVLSDSIIVKASCKSGEGFIDKMIKLVEGAKRQKTPNEIALTILLSAITLVFLVVCAALVPFSEISIALSGQGKVITPTIVIALLICLAPTTIGGLVSAIGVAGMNRLLKKNVIALSGRAVEAAGDVDVLLLDKTGTITLGNRYAVEFYPEQGYARNVLVEASYISSLSDDTPEGKSIIDLALSQHITLPPKDELIKNGVSVAFSAQTRVSGFTMDSREIRKGAKDRIYKMAKEAGYSWSQEFEKIVDAISARGGTPLLVSENSKILGVIELKDIVKTGIRDRFASLRKMGIKTVMVTGDNPLTAAAIAAEAGVDDFIAEATPENKMDLIKKYQNEGRLVAMTGDGTNDAPALAQADVAVAMNSGTQAAKEAGNMIDLDSNPTKLLEVVETGKQLLITRGALTTFSLANDIAKYFAIVPAAFASTYPVLVALDIMYLSSPKSAILSAVIFNAVIIPALIPLALRGVKYSADGAEVLLRRNILTYGVGGLILPFVGIKAIDMLISLFGGLS